MCKHNVNGMTALETDIFDAVFAIDVGYSPKA